MNRRDRLMATLRGDRWIIRRFVFMSSTGWMNRWMMPIPSTSIHTRLGRRSLN